MTGDPFSYGDQPDPHAFIQWKGTDVCLDFYCDCGTQGHFDGDFAYQLRCPACDTVWEMPWHLYPRRATDVRDGVCDIEVDEPDRTLGEHAGTVPCPTCGALRERTPVDVTMLSDVEPQAALIGLAECPNQGDGRHYHGM